MEIDLAKVLRYSAECLQSRAQMRAIMMDMYPGKTRDMNVLLSVYESGIPNKIKNDGQINGTQYKSYVKKIADDYGMKEIYITEALNAWIDIFLGSGTATSLNTDSTDMPGSKQRDFNTQPNPKNNFYANNNQNGQMSQSIPVGDQQWGTYVVPNAYASVSAVNNSNVSLSSTQGRSSIQPNNQIYSNIFHVINRTSASDYELNDTGNGTLVINNYLGFVEEETVIPSEIKGKKIIGIDTDAFRQCDRIKRLIIPEGIEFICNGAFADCTNLTYVSLPSTIKYLGYFDYDYLIKNRFAFKNSNESINGVFENTNISEISLPYSVKQIGQRCFLNCHKLEKIYLPKLLDTIGFMAFWGCEKLSEIIFPKTVRNIKMAAFCNCTNLSNIILNEGLEKIEAYAFQNCESLKEITIPRTVYSFGEDIFVRGTDKNKKNLDITIRCYPGTKAIEYAQKNNLNNQGVYTRRII